MAEIRLAAVGEIMRVLLGSLLAIAVAVPAHADEVDNVRSAQVAVNGSIGQRCSLGTASAMDLGDFARPGLTAARQIPLDCNVPFQMVIRAQNGSLTHSELPRGQGPYAGSVPYRIGLSMPIRQPQSQLVARSFEGRELQGDGAMISSEGGIAVEGLALKLSLDRPSGDAGLLAGKYGETIEITIRPS